LVLYTSKQKKVKYLLINKHKKKLKMPYVIDTIEAKKYIETPNFIRKVNMKNVDNKAVYPSADVSSCFSQTGVIQAPTRNLNMYNLKSMMTVNEADQDNYFLVAGTIQCDTTPTISKVTGSFNNVSALPTPVSNTYSYGSAVDTVSGMSPTTMVEGAEVFLFQTGDRDYAVVAAMFTPESEYFKADVTMDVEIIAESPITFSNEVVLV
jgi:hypothetical protein